MKIVTNAFANSEFLLENQEILVLFTMDVVDKDNNLIYGQRNSALKIILTLKSVNDDSINLIGELFSDQKVLFK